MNRIAILGRTNAGKSSLLNLITGQETAIVSPQPGTTTDPVQRTMHLPHHGAVLWIDTAGFDDQSPLGTQRTRKTLLAIAQADAAVFVAYGTELDPVEKEFIATHLEGKMPFTVVYKPFEDHIIERLTKLLPQPTDQSPSDFFNHLLQKGETVVLVCPIDDSTPVGKLIMPQLAAIRAALDLHATALVVQPQELAQAIEQHRPQLVVTDSQVFDTVRATVPESIEVTSFSILLATNSGCLPTYLQGAQQIRQLSPGDRVLLIEHCTHQTTCHDIARVKIPQLLGPQIQTTVIRGKEAMEEDFAPYQLVVQCGGCVASKALVRNITRRATAQGVKVTNFGLLLKELLSGSKPTK